ncbi:MAG: ATP-binding protein [Humidesulfovibrio sp.]|jgi:PAS domain S-box-containing protein|uniref:two-component system sensor histidine kinase NtrB n=1 Tax=Humidesulfovibrio sp. TaxID=2910988 RepID=UPI002735604F|nr:ATP-binding protein [Humidesulfovibrio sp.]MDP2848309.1 ATP-binding protein [Humidesulfovibrio sp.]
MVDSLRADKQYRIGLVGDKSSLVPFWELFASLGNERVLAQLGIKAMALHDEAPPGSDFANTLGLPVHPGWRQMLESHPDLNLVIETTGREAVISQLRKGLPLSITLVERGAASFFLRLLSSDQMWVACKIDLLHTQTLLKGIIDQLKEEIVLADGDGLVLDCNKAALESQGLPKSDIVGKPLRNFFRVPEGLNGNFVGLPPLEHALATGEAMEATLAHVDAEGLLHYTREYVNPIQGEAGQRTSYLCIRRDITSRTQMEQRLQQSERLASIGEMSTYIAHEIRNPLFAIGGFANQLLRTVGEPAAREKIEIIIEESKRLDSILKSILTFAKPVESNGLSDLNQIVRDTMELMGMACENLSITPVLVLTDELPLVKADAELIKQCLINLVKNSLEAMPTGGTLSVRTSLHAARVILEVDDTGQGIAPDIRDKVFSPFFSTKGRGTGLGLAMIKKILDDLGGTVELSSVPGEGTRVALHLPPQLAVAKQEADR